MPLEFNALTKALFNQQVPVTEGLKTDFRRRRRLVGGPGLEKTRDSTLNNPITMGHINFLEPTSILNPLL